MQTPTFPFALPEAVDSADNQIGPKSPCIAPEHLERAVGGDEQREDIEPAGVNASEVRSGARRGDDERLGLGRGPEVSVDHGLAVRAQGSLMTEKSRVGSGGDQAAAPIENLDGAIAINSVR